MNQSGYNKDLDNRCLEPAGKHLSPWLSHQGTTLVYHYHAGLRGTTQDFAELGGATREFRNWKPGDLIKQVSSHVRSTRPGRPLLHFHLPLSCPDPHIGWQCHFHLYWMPPGKSTFVQSTLRFPGLSLVNRELS